MIFEISGLYDIHICLKTGLIETEWKTGLSSVIFITYIKIATCTKKVDMPNPVNSDWG